ncbi:MAG: hypothetical protein RIA08_06205 [Roseovarius sp.]|uniref:hypothetical protein n=1 Tax=Bacteria TaxID=2 RepID=UPI0032EEADBA
MHINRKYELPNRTVEILSTRLTSLHAARFVHGLLGQLDWMYGSVSGAGPVLIKPQTIWCDGIAQLTAARGCKDRRWMQRGIADLKGTDLFDELEQPDPKRVTFLISNRFRTSLLSKKTEHGFAKLQSDDYAESVSIEEAIFVMLVRLYEGRDWPVFNLPYRPVSQKSRCLNYKASATSGEAANDVDLQTREAQVCEWAAAKKRWCRAAERVADRLGHSYLIAPYCGPLDPGISQVRVKIQHEKTKWQPERLYKFQVGSGRVIQVMPGKRHRSLSQQELRERLWDTVIR